VTQPRISDLRRGKISTFSLDSLIGIAKKVGLTVELRIAREDFSDTPSKHRCEA
jgi:predicted XRE-type DNA-binding protein